MPNCLLKQLYHFAFTQAMNEGFLLPHILISTWWCQHSIFWPFNCMCSVRIFFCFYLWFHDDMWYGASFHLLICYLYIFFGEVPLNVLEPFFRWFDFLLLNFKCSFYILDNSTLCIICAFCKYFLQVCGFFSSSCIVSLTEQMFIISVKFNF